MRTIEDLQNRKKEILKRVLEECGGDINKAWYFFRDVDIRPAIVPLVKKDREVLGLSYGKLAKKYGLNTRQVEYIITNR